MELAFWAPSPRGQGPGFYWCVRAFMDQDDEIVGGVVFCFWDGSESSPGFSTIEAALSHATRDGFGDSDV